MTGIQWHGRSGSTRSSDAKRPWISTKPPLPAVAADLLENRAGQ